MRWSHSISCLLVGLLFLAGCQTPAPRTAATTRPKLILLVIFDQMRGDYLSRWADQFGEGGFRRVCRDGAWFTNCHYPYACTMTGPGHASLSTGCSPDRHGIVMNEWYDRALGKEINCAFTDRSTTVYTVPRPVNADGTSPKHSGNAERMLAPSFSDALKSATGGAARVAAMSLKDRSACMPAGKNADACYWFDSRTGTFVTSTYYRDRAHDWVASFNAAKPADRWFGQLWERVRPDLDYVPLSGPDDVIGEAAGAERTQSRVFPHNFESKSKLLDSDYYEQICSSPFGNDLLAEFAKATIHGLELGRDATTDFLSVSFSSNDLVGHTFGPDSQEVMDTTLRSDLMIADLLNCLDQEVGPGQYLLAITADHGICPLPEVSAAKGLDARRVHPDLIRDSIESHMNELYVLPYTTKWLDSMSLPWIYLNHRMLAGRRINVADAAGSLAKWLRKQDWVAAAYTRADLADAARQDPYIAAVRKSYFPGRCGDVAIVMRPYYLASGGLAGTTHGSPHAYDTHVPMVLYGTGVVAGKYDEPITPQSIVAAFSHVAGVSPPAFIEAPVPSHGLGTVRRRD